MLCTSGTLDTKISPWHQMRLTWASWGEPKILDVAANNFFCNPPKFLTLDGGKKNKQKTQLLAVHMQYPIRILNYLTYI